MITPAEHRTRLALQVCDKTSPRFVVELQLALPSTANLREHHHVKARRNACQRELVTQAFWNGVSCLRTSVDLTGDLVVRIVRHAPRSLDSDNLASSAKAVRDAVAAWLGVDDASEHVVWLVAQERAKVASVTIEIYSAVGAVS